MRRGLLSLAALLLWPRLVLALGLAELPHQIQTFTSVVVDETSPTTDGPVATLTVTGLSAQAGTYVVWADWTAVSAGTGDRYYACTIRQTSSPAGSCLDTAASADFQSSNCDAKYGKKLGSGELSGGFVANVFPGISDSITLGLYCELNKKASGVTVTLTGTMTGFHLRSHDGHALLDAANISPSISTVPASASMTNVISHTFTALSAQYVAIAVVAARPPSGSGDRRYQIQIALDGSPVGLTNSTNLEANDDMDTVALFARVNITAGTRTIALQHQSPAAANARASILIVFPTLTNDGISFPNTTSSDVTCTGCTNPLSASPTFETLASASLGTTAPTSANPGSILMMGSVTAFPNDPGSGRAFHLKLNEIHTGDAGAVWSGGTQNAETDEYQAGALLRVTTVDSDNSHHTVTFSGASGTSGDFVDVSDSMMVAMSLIPVASSVPPTPLPSNTPTATGTATATPVHTSTATATDTPAPASTATNTATATETPTVTPITPPACFPDITGPTPGVPDGLRILGIDVDERIDGALTEISETVVDPDGICERDDLPTTTALHIANSSSYGVRGRQELLTATTGSLLGRCIVAGTILRGQDGNADIELLTIAPYTDFMRTYAAPRRTCLCYGGANNGQSCRVNAPNGIMSLARNEKCVTGSGAGSNCRKPNSYGLVPTPCAQETPGNQNDPLLSRCKSDVYSASDVAAQVTGCAAPGLCHCRSTFLDAMQNIVKAADAIVARGAVPLVFIPYLPGIWNVPDGSDPSKPVTPLPNGTPIPGGTYAAPHEPAFTEIRALIQWARIWVNEYKHGPLPYIDAQRYFEYRTGGRPTRLLGSSKLMSDAGLGHCTCLLDADCGAGGTCTDNWRCTAGARSICTTDLDCVGTNSQAHPGYGHCITEEGDDAVAQLLRDCLERRAQHEKPELEALDILRCSHPFIPENVNPQGTPLCTPWPTITLTPTVTHTVTPTPALTFTPTETFTIGPSPTRTNTATASPTPLGTIPPGTDCNNSGSHGMLANKMGAQCRRPWEEWGTCLGRNGSAPATCDVSYPGDSSSSDVPDYVDSMRCVNELGASKCDVSIGRTEGHAEDKFCRGGCDKADWHLAIEWTRVRAAALGEPVPPAWDLHKYAAHAPTRCWEVYEWFEIYYVKPTIEYLQTWLRGYTSPNPPMTNACEGAIVERFGWRTGNDWIAGTSAKRCVDAFTDSQVVNHCFTNNPGLRKIAPADWEAVCTAIETKLRPLYEGVRAASGKSY